MTYGRGRRGGRIRRARQGWSLSGRVLGEGLCVCVRVWRWRDPIDRQTPDELQQGTVLGMYLS